MNLNVQLQFVFSLIEDIINSLRSNLLCVSSHLSQKNDNFDRTALRNDENLKQSKQNKKTVFIVKEQLKTEFCFCRVKI